MEFIGLVNSLGPTAIIILLLVVVIMLLQRYRDEVKGQSLKLSKHIDEQKEIDKEQEEKIVFISQHYVTKEDMYQQFGGWRSELSTVNQNILHLTEIIAKKGDE